MRASFVALGIGLALAAACSRGLSGDGSAGSCAIADPSLAYQVQVEATQEHVAERDVTQVSAPRVGTLEGVECLRQLLILNVGSSPISDLSPLAGHPTLDTLFLSDANVRDLGPLGSVPHLHSLEVSGSGLGSFDGLVGASELTRLIVDQNPLTSLAGVESLPALIELSARQTSADSLAPLAGATSLATLDVSGSPVVDLTPLATVPRLSSVSISDTAVSDLSPLSKQALQSLSADGTLVTDLTPLAGSSGTLTFLDVSRTPVTSLAPLSGAAMLETVYASNARLETLAGLHDLPELRHLVVSGNAISDLSPLTALSPLWLDVTQNPLDNAAAGIIQSLCAAGWAVNYEDTSCGNTCDFVSCTD